MNLVLKTSKLYDFEIPLHRLHVAEGVPFVQFAKRSSAGTRGNNPQRCIKTKCTDIQQVRMCGLVVNGLGTMGS